MTAFTGNYIMLEIRWSFRTAMEAVWHLRRTGTAIPVKKPKNIRWKKNRKNRKKLMNWKKKQKQKKNRKQ